MWGIIATWRMAIEGVEEASKRLSNNGNCLDAIEEAVKIVEDNPHYRSVGFGGLPNENCEVELDAAFMDGDTLSIGAVGGIKDFKNPISIARKLSNEKFNSFLVGTGAEEYANKNGFERRNNLTEISREYYENKRKENIEKGLVPYDGHDTVGMVSLDNSGRMASATSTSGLFMKKRGRVGDSPVSGSGFYVDSKIGGASATGLGEDLMKGCISYEVVRLMGEGLHPQEAVQIAVTKLNNKLIERRGSAGDISVICMNNKGQFGVATNINQFAFCVATKDNKPTVYLTKLADGKTTYEEASKDWLDNYAKMIITGLE